LENGFLPSVKDEGPDGGYGWLVVLGAFCVQVTSFGVVSSWGRLFRLQKRDSWLIHPLTGVMQDYFHQAMFSSNPEALLDLSFVGALALVFVNGASPIVQVCVARYGLLPVMITGTLFITLALEMAGFAIQVIKIVLMVALYTKSFLFNKVWHLYLTQSVLFGVGASCMYVTVLSVTPQWFTRHRGTALGIVASGSGVGGLIVPFIVTPLNRNLGYVWTYRILGLICLICNIIACIFVKERIPRFKEKKKLSQVIQFNVLKNTNFLLFSIGSDIMLFGYFVPLFLFQVDTMSQRRTIN
jgi:hypothetical protein